MSLFSAIIRDVVSQLDFRDKVSHGIFWFKGESFEASDNLPDPDVVALEIVNERGGVTPDMALRLSKAFTTTPELWLNLQRNYDLRKAAHKSNDWKLVEAITVVPHL